MSDRLWRIRVGEREHRVEILGGGNGDPTRVLVDGHEFEVAEAGIHAFRVAPTSDEDRRQIEVNLAGHSRPDEAWLAGIRAKLEVRSEREAKLAHALGQTSGARSSGELRAPMPGRVVKVLVELGQTIERGAPVMIVEAMKMENELQAPATGVVQRIDVGAGATVDANQVLCVIEV